MGRMQAESADSAQRVNIQITQQAELIIVVSNDNTYKIAKDRFHGGTGESFPIEELPELLKQRMAEKLRWKDGIATDD